MSKFNKSERKRLKRERREQEKRAQDNPQQAVTPDEPAPQNIVETPEAPKHDEGARQHRRWNLPEFVKRSVFWQLVFSACLVAFTFGQVIVGHWQWDATDKQYHAMLEANKITKGQLELLQVDQQPSISIEDLSISGLAAGEQPKIGMLIRNSGGSEATIIGATFNATLENWKKGRFSVDFSEHLHSGVTDFYSTAIAATSSLRHDVWPLPVMTAEQIHQLRTRDKIIFVSGFITYRDRNWKEYYAECFYIYDMEKERFDPHTGYSKIK